MAPIGDVNVAGGVNRHTLWTVEVGEGQHRLGVRPGRQLHHPIAAVEHVYAAGNVYVVDDDNKRVVKLAAGSNTQTVLPFTGLAGIEGMAVDTAGNVYLTDLDNRHVVKLAAGSNTQTVLPFTGLNDPDAVAVDSAGNVYVLDHSGFGQVVKLAAN